MQHIGRVRGLTKLRVSGISADDSNLTCLEGLKLTTLSVNDSQFTSPGIEKLVSLFPDLTYLDLSRSKIADADMVFIGKLTQLKSLQLNGTQVGDEGLTKLDGLTKLTFFTASAATVSEYGKHQFELAHPGANIYLQ